MELDKFLQKAKNWSLLVLWRNKGRGRRRRQEKVPPHIQPTGATEHQMDVTDRCSSGSSEQTNMIWHQMQSAIREERNLCVVFWESVNALGPLSL